MFIMNYIPPQLNLKKIIETYIEQQICQKIPLVNPKIYSAVLCIGLRTSSEIIKAGDYINKCYRDGCFIHCGHIHTFCVRVVFATKSPKILL